MIAGFFNVLAQFAFFYPLLMALVWISGGILFFIRHEQAGRTHPCIPPQLPHYPGVSILVPCFNEGQNIYETIYWLDQMDYPDFEIIAINDGSSDKTVKILLELTKQFDKLRVADLTTNQGKAMSLRMGALVAKHEYLVGIDGDAILDANALTWLMSHMLADPKCGAVTGMPLVRTRSTLIGKIQVGEFSAIIGLIKRTQQMLGYLFTVSGVVSAFRKSALHEVGYWNLNMITEDIDITWRLQIAGWSVAFEPNAMCWILCPETLRGLWKQRLRWAQGGAEAALRHGKTILFGKKYRLWVMLGDYFLSVLWAYAMLALFAFSAYQWIAGHWQPAPSQLLPSMQGLMLGTVCVLQFGVSLFFNARFEAGTGRYFYWIIWYPIIFWLISLLTTIIAVPKAILKRKGERAIWTSPDRGIGSGS
ncbi:MAG: poly-beta-1,6 N-acetyl-D-glucosamine synthase [Gammaproteobacteria bacterium]|nr:MAG: poly-beta-1,6 N-acetyl-D-glucosamine synthase [Gammaproteobacteria bacterium]